MALVAIGLSGCRSLLDSGSTEFSVSPPTRGRVLRASGVPMEAVRVEFDNGDYVDPSARIVKSVTTDPFGNFEVRLDWIGPFDVGLDPLGDAPFVPLGRLVIDPAEDFEFVYPVTPRTVHLALPAALEEQVDYSQGGRLRFWFRRPQGDWQRFEFELGSDGTTEAWLEERPYVFFARMNSPILVYDAIEPIEVPAVGDITVPIEWTPVRVVLLRGGVRAANPVQLKSIFRQYGPDDYLEQDITVEDGEFDVWGREGIVEFELFSNSFLNHKRLVDSSRETEVAVEIGEFDVSILLLDTVGSPMSLTPVKVFPESGRSTQFMTSELGELDLFLGQGDYIVQVGSRSQQVSVNGDDSFTLILSD